MEDVTIMAELSKLKSRILRLLREDEEFRYAVAGLIGLSEVLKRFEEHDKKFNEILARLDKHEEMLLRQGEEIRRLREDMIAGFKRHDELFEKHWQEIARLREDMMEGFKRHDEEIRRLREDMIAGFKRHDEEFAKVWSEIARLREDMVAGFKRHDEEIAKLREDMVAGFKRNDEEFAKIWSEMARLREDMIAGFKRHDEEIARVWSEIARLREDMIAGFKRHDELFEKHWQEIVRLREDMKRGFSSIMRHLDALGARWGLLSERAFREGLRMLVEEELGFKVEEWVKRDEEGYVYGHPSDVDLDVAVRDEKVILIEIKSHVRRSDVLVFKRKAEFYEKVEGRKPDRLLMITPYVDEDALDTAKKLQVEVYTGV